MIKTALGSDLHHQILLSMLVRKVKHVAARGGGFKKRGEPLDLCAGPPGLGKTTMAAMVANEMRLRICGLLVVQLLKKQAIWKSFG